MICLTCGTTKINKHGDCINSHDNWFEWEDLFYDNLYLDLLERLQKKLNMNSSELVVKLFKSSPYKLKEQEAIQRIFQEDFILGD